MKITTSASDAANKIDRFLSSNSHQIELRFPDGFFLHIKKRINRGTRFLEIHTSGYDGTLEEKEAVDWISWEIIDNTANGILTN